MATASFEGGQVQHSAWPGGAKVLVKLSDSVVKVFAEP